MAKFLMVVGFWGSWAGLERSRDGLKIRGFRTRSSLRRLFVWWTWSEDEELGGLEDADLPWGFPSQNSLDWKMIILCIGNCEIELTPMYILKTDQSSSPCTLAAGSKMARSEASLAPMTTIESPGDFPREVDLRRKAFRERSVQKN